MIEWGDGRTGRTVTWPTPDTYVLVDGVLLRTEAEPPGLPPGTAVTVRHVPGRRLPVSRPDDDVERAS
ncbi:hypothetical protein DNK56_15755 [Streptomyces sp. AC1-42W]|nr:hypothetical protein DNK55_15670 [Streptomyces sp. AC1-42T]PZT83975.1 hypothetical protein DNK56_15755 [Streptomyces sp. AC1-42W]